MNDESGSKTWKYVGIGCGIAALLGLCSVGGCLLFCGGTIGAIFAATEAPVAATRVFLGHVRSGNTAAAYEEMASSYRAHTSLEGFQAAISAMPEVTGSTDETITQRNVSQNGADIGGFVTGPNGTAPFQAHLVEEGDAWRIDSLTVSGRPL